MRGVRPPSPDVPNWLVRLSADRVNSEASPLRDIPHDSLYELSSFDGHPAASLAGCIVSQIAVDFSRDRAEPGPVSE